MWSAAAFDRALSLMVEKAEKGGELILGLASADAFTAALRGARITLASQDADLNYIGALNPAFLFDGETAFTGRSDGDLLPAPTSDKLTACKRRVAASGAGESIDVALARDGRTQWFRLWVEPISSGGD